MSENTCGGCKRLVPHYVIGENALLSVSCGHCTYPRLKHRRPDAKACEYFEPGIRDRSEKYASKKYLTKALVKCILERDLLPEIRDALLEHYVEREK